MPKNDIVIRAMQSRDEIPLIADMLGKSFDRGYQTMWEQAHRAHTTSPYFHVKYTRLAILDGEIVGHVRIQPNVFRLGAAELWVAGIGDVSTHFQQRKRGIAAAAMDDSIEFMQREGFDLSVLFGIANFYHRFAYAPIIPPPPTLTLDLHTVEPLPQEHRGRPFRKADIPRLNAFKKKYDPLDTLTVRRTRAHWRYRLKWWQGCPLFHDKRGRLVGYARMPAEQDQVLIREAIALADERVYASILREAARRARKHVVKRIALHLPPDHPMAEYCIRLGCQYTMQYRKNADGMGRILNLRSFIEKMLPEWNRLLSQSELEKKDASLALSVDGERAMLRAKGGRLVLDGGASRTKNVLRLTAQQFLQAAVGYPAFSLSRSCLRDARSRRMAEILFPKRHPYMWRTDGF